ncbi:FAD-dependent oxidoreductase [Actinoalloteichus hymeniacidonis]|uniref:BFD-like (2Fe-2S) protein n=1 Tax=Actinoalloteichus hymeniacidonis TaxID=340345 RepID=A0AAC9MXV5_9PSEU|nr:FAD-dependent oxidoreductase [Actinoalloteichus hymeniacidonis]AOS62670.1 BFD-like (2Fe-2S) protein [Actinoalloteichus hymeniacidonis]MBB5909299.1 assimilatory nitrate reductase electron transfer subunit [Actinoalloteichus hymeniacidonis]
MSRRQVVLVGYGMAGARLAEEIRRRDPAGDRVALTVIGEEPHPAYNRVLLSSVVAGSLPADAVLLQDEDWALRNLVDLRRGTRVTAIERSAARIRLDDGGSVPYDDLVLATGSSAWLPELPGLRGADGGLGDGVVPFRTLEDCARITAGVRAGGPMAVLGGGLLGLEAARGLAGRGVEVTVVHPDSQLMQRQLDADASRVLVRTLDGLGVRFRLGVPAVAHRPGVGLLLADGTTVPAELTVVATGVRPSVGLAREAGLAVDRGVLIDDLLRTDDPRIAALGDCAQHPGGLAGQVQSAWEQAPVLADLLTGADPSARYTGTTTVTRLKARDVDLAALGEVHVPVDSPDSEVLCLQDPVRGRYAKLVLRDERIAGAILLGAPDAAATITRLFDRQARVPEDRLALLLGRALPAENGGEHGIDGVVCRCNSVRRDQLVQAWESGARSVPDIADQTRATTGCGGCREDVCSVLSWLSDREPATTSAGVG